MEGFDQSLRKNKQGRLYHPGIGDDLVWAKIYDINRSNKGELSQKEIAEQVLFCLCRN